MSVKNKQAYLLGHAITLCLLNQIIFCFTPVSEIWRISQGRSKLFQIFRNLFTLPTGEQKERVSGRDKESLLSEGRGTAAQSKIKSLHWILE